MIRRSRGDAVECRVGGDHTAHSTRLRVAAARWSDAIIAARLAEDEVAQHWLGPAIRQDHGLPLGRNPLLLTTAYLAFAGIHMDRLLAYVTLTRCADGSYDVGGVTHAAVRGQGYGRETLQTVCRIAHHHFGFGWLRATCESTNQVGAQWLRSAGFVQVGPQYRVTLPNGRVAHHLPWQRVEPTARSRCANLPGA
jgi:RimJ/RimL family protein N-acetyltransferase